jgi:hypothetical protein
MYLVCTNAVSHVKLRWHPLAVLMQADQALALLAATIAQQQSVLNTTSDLTTTQLLYLTATLR